MLTKSVKVTVEVPEGSSDKGRESASRKAHESAVIALWEAGDLSIREAADELGLNYADYLDLLAERGVPVARGPLDEAALADARRKLAETRP